MKNKSKDRSISHNGNFGNRSSHSMKTPTTGQQQVHGPSAKRKRSSADSEKTPQTSDDLKRARRKEEEKHDVDNEREVRKEPTEKIPSDEKAPVALNDQSKKISNLAKLPENAFINKRPLLHPPIPSPYAGADKPKHIYISSSSSFMGTVKRAQKLLLLAEDRFNKRLEAAKGQNDEKSRTGLKKGKSTENIEEVVLKGTGRAIERLVSIVAFLQKKDEYAVRLKAGTVNVVDDIEMRKKGKSENAGNEPRNGTEDPPGGQEDGSDEDSAFETQNVQGGNKSVENMPETRVRQVSMLEAGITLKSIVRHHAGHGHSVDGYQS